MSRREDKARSVTVRLTPDEADALDTVMRATRLNQSDSLRMALRLTCRIQHLTRHLPPGWFTTAQADRPGWTIPISFEGAADESG